MTESSLAEVLASKRTAIFGMFVEKVMRDDVAPVPAGTRRSEIIDHLPLFLDDMIATLERERAPESSAADAADEQLSAARQHGRDRLRLGFDVEAVVREYGILRDCILSVIGEANLVPTVAEIALFSKCIDLGTANAVAEYSRQKHDDLERAVRAREEVLAIVSHDLRTPLNAIVMSTHVLASRLPAQSREYKVTQAIARSADQMTKMISDLLDLAMIDGGRLTLDVQPVLPSLLLDQAAALVEAQAREQNVRIVVGDCLELPDVSCQQESILRVFANLLENALRHTAADRDVTLSAERDGDFVRFVVSDSGSGIAEEHLTRIFERFYRVREQDRIGTGLGLYIARGLVNASGGAIGVTSEPGSGSRFWFTLPIDGIVPSP